MVTQIFNLASTPAGNNQMNTSQTNALHASMEQKKYAENKKLLKKIKTIIKSNNNSIPKVNFNVMNFQHRQKECYEDSEVLFIVEQLQQQANKTQSNHSESILLQFNKFLFEDLKF